MKIAMAASEAAPFLKTGGLGDVMEALPQALTQIPKNEVSVFLPFYGAIKYDDRFEKEFLGYFDVPLAWRREYVGVFRLKSRKKKLKIYFIDKQAAVFGKFRRRYRQQRQRGVFGLQLR